MSDFTVEDCPGWYTKTFWLMAWDAEWQDQEQLKWELQHSEVRKLRAENRVMH